MNLIKRSWNEIKNVKRAYIVLNLVYYGLVALGMIVVSFSPEVQETLLKSVGSAFSQGPLAMVGGAYSKGKVISAVGLTFVVNLFLGSVVYITLSSLVIPFLGLLLGGYRALLWGLLFSPTTHTLRMTMIPHSLTLLLEGQAYIMVMVAAYVQGKTFIWPKSTEGAVTHFEGYKAGLKKSMRIYILVVLMLAAAAIYEALEVIFVVPIFLRL